jgi:hypothetical protein
MRYRLFLDEVGNDDLDHADDERHRFLSLTGIIMGERYAATTATQRLDAIKARYFGGLPSNQVIFHRKDIMNRKGPFHVLRDDLTRDLFDDALIYYIQDLDFCVLSIVIDKFAMRRMTHWKKMHPYHFLMEILIEKYVRFLQDRMSTGDIMPEARRGRFDRELQAAYESVRKNGTDYVTAAVICNRLPTHDLKFKSKRDNIAGLQLCDLIAHPSHQFIRKKHGWDVEQSPFAERVMEFVEPYKYHRRYDDNRIVGFGIKYLP